MLISNFLIQQAYQTFVLGVVRVNEFQNVIHRALNNTNTQYNILQLALIASDSYLYLWVLDDVALFVLKLHLQVIQEDTIRLNVCIVSHSIV